MVRYWSGLKWDCRSRGGGSCDGRWESLRRGRRGRRLDLSPGTHGIEAIVMAAIRLKIAEGLPDLEMKQNIIEEMLLQSSYLV